MFDGNARWLEVGVRTNGSGAFTTLSPRQSLTPAPYASYTPSAGSAALATMANGVAVGSITSAALAPGAVTGPALAPGAVSQLGTPNGTQTNVVQVDTNGWVGIGTNTPHAGVEIAGGSSLLGAVVCAEVREGTGSFTNLAGANGVAFSTNLLALASMTGNALTFVNTASDNLTYLSGLTNGQGSFTNLTSVQDVAFWTNRILAAAAPSANAVTIIALTNTSVPVWKSVLRDGVGEFGLLAGAYAVAFNDRMLAIAANTDNAVSLVTVTNPAVPRLLGYLQNGYNTVTNLGGPRAVAFSDNLLAIAAYSSNSVVLADVSTPSSPVQKATIKQGLNGFTSMLGPQAVAFSGNLLAIAAGTSLAVNLVDVANPRQPGPEIHHCHCRQRQSRGIVLFLAERPQPPGREQLLPTIRSGFMMSPIHETGGRARCSSTVWRACVTWTARRKLAVNADGRLAVAAYTSSAVTLLGWADQQVGLASDTWVGIGTTLPKAALDVNGDVLIENANRFQASASHVELGGGVASGNMSTAIGDQTTASGNYSTALGYQTVASGDSSTAMGKSTVASGTRSTAMGESTTASGAASTALGYNTAATNAWATALGASSTAGGAASLAAGSSTLATGAGAVALGNRAKALHDGTLVWADSQAADFASSSSNQFLIRAGGGVGINQTSPTATLDVNGPVRVNDKDIFLRTQTDTNHGVGWYGAGKTFGTNSPDGPALYGWSGEFWGPRRAGRKQCSPGTRTAMSRSPRTWAWEAT